MLSIPWYIFLLQFIAGLFLANGVPLRSGDQRRVVPDPVRLTAGRRRILARGQRAVGVS